MAYDILIKNAKTRETGSKLMQIAIEKGKIVKIAEQVAGDAMRQAGISGNVIFDASWDAQLGQQLKLQASVVRTQGDLVLTRKDPATDIETRIADEGLPPANGQRYVLPGGAFFDIANGRIARVSNYYNLPDWIRQVGG